jgi:NDP-sugar pyrophosphorylase family protein
MILAAGSGKRLRPLTAYCPKPALPLLGRPLIEYTLRSLSRRGIRDVVVNLHHRAEALDRALDRAPDPVTLHRSIESELLGTAGGLKKVERYFSDGTFLLLNGDTLVDFDFDGLVSSHREHEAKATLLLRHKPGGTDYSVVSRDTTERILSVSRGAGRGPELMFAGVWVLEPSVFSYLSGRPAGLETELLPRLIEEGSVFGCVQDVSWITIDTPRRYWESCMAMVRNGLFSEDWDVAPVAPKGNGRSAASVYAGKRTRLAAQARFRGYVVLGSGCKVKRGAHLQNSVLWDDVEVPAGARLVNTIVTEGVSLPDGANIEDRVVMKVGEDRTGLRRSEIKDGLLVSKLKSGRPRGL